ncbi:kinase-like domain-containing protein [Rhexocercosporidium sp. MPI-PUGE-AT-0058]|nr:kinase-like domain-containing protein [Rhexocercosporidium sp. MPI-PUGE-AT-0058]
MPLVLPNRFRHRMRALRAVRINIGGCFVGAPKQPKTIVHRPSTTEIDGNTSNHQPTRENSSSSRHLHPATPITSPTVISPSENRDPASQPDSPSPQSSLEIFSSTTSTPEIHVEVEKSFGTSPDVVLPSPADCDSTSIPSSFLFDLANTLASSPTPLDTPLPSPSLICLADAPVSNSTSLDPPLSQTRPPRVLIQTNGCTPDTEPSEGLENASHAERGSRSVEGKLMTAEIPDPPSLREQLGKAQYEPWRDNRYFIPNNDLRRLITPESVLRQMKMETGLGRTPIQEQTALMISERAHKLYAALVFTRLGQHICDFLEEGIDDSDLPFARLDSRDDSRTFSLCSKKSPREPLNCLATWNRSDVCELAKSQWYMLAPVLEFTDNIEHYDFDRYCILPWMEDHEFSSQGHMGGAIEGGFGSVWKIKIHPAHQRLVRELHSAERRPSQVSSLPTNGLECPYIFAAVKRLHSIDENKFKSEIEMLKELRRHPHDHLVRLLATFRWNKRYYLLFPYADSNLREYWRANPVPVFTYDNVFWVLQQCRAITSGLYVVHEQRYTHASSGNSNHNKQCRYGRHGDLKAENILWFRKGSEFGQLVIADFGLMDCHELSTRSDIPADGITGSPSYEPPELTLHGSISRSYDIWTLGCLYLELITWLVSGWEALERFPDARREQVSQEPHFVDDTFFTIMADNSPGAQLKYAIIRDSVSSWIADLHEMPRCSHFVHEFLNLISKHMLVVDPVARIRIAGLNQEIQDMIIKAKNNPSYLTEGVAHTPRTQLDPHQSSLAALGLKGSKFPGTADGTPLPRKSSL